MFLLPLFLLIGADPGLCVFLLLLLLLLLLFRFRKSNQFDAFPVLVTFFTLPPFLLIVVLRMPIPVLLPPLIPLRCMTGLVISSTCPVTFLNVAKPFVFVFSSVAATLKAPKNKSLAVASLPALVFFLVPSPGLLLVVKNVNHCLEVGSKPTSV